MRLRWWSIGYYSRAMSEMSWVKLLLPLKGSLTEMKNYIFWMELSQGVNNVKIFPFCQSLLQN